MLLSEIPVPEVYKESADFRFFLRWIELCFTRSQYNTDNLIDLLDPLRCPSNLVWMLGDTCGFKYDERVSKAFNRLVILNFSKMINYRGSQNGMTFAAEINLDQFNLQNYAKENPKLEDRLEDTSIPVNSVSITPHTKEGYIDVVYYSERIPIDVCLEYVRPLGMYTFSHAGVAINARTKVSVDARLTTINDGNVKPGPAFIGHYRRADYASLQKEDPDGTLEPRRQVYYRNSKYEGETTSFMDPGYRSLYSLQLSNNEHIVKALLPSLEEPEKIFSLGFGPENVETVYPDNYLKTGDDPLYNLRVDRNLEESYTPAVYTVESAEDILTPKPAVNPPMFHLGDAISLNDMNTQYTEFNRETGEIEVRGVDPLGEDLKDSDD